MMKTLMKPLLRRLALTVALLGGAAQAADPALDFALIGDLPYSPWETRELTQMLQYLGGQPLGFVVHAGDFKSGSSRCDDQVYKDRYAQLDATAIPLIFVPGDNEWTDCHRSSNGGFEPRERLAYLRKTFYPDQRSLGQRKMDLARQSEHPRFSAYRENVRWEHGGVLFVGLNVTGSNNNFGRTADGDAEYRERSVANQAWLAEAFWRAAAPGVRGLVVVIQANPFFELPVGHKSRSGYEDFIQQMADGALALNKPVALLHGDTHTFRIDRPLQHPKTGAAVGNLLRVETPGSPDVGWVRGRILPNHPAVFRFERGELPWQPADRWATGE